MYASWQHADVYQGNDIPSSRLFRYLLRQVFIYPVFIPTNGSIWISILRNIEKHTFQCSPYTFIILGSEIIVVYASRQHADVYRGNDIPASRLFRYLLRQIIIYPEFVAANSSIWIGILWEVAEKPLQCSHIAIGIIGAEVEEMNTLRHLTDVDRKNLLIIATLLTDTTVDIIIHPILITF